jgi:predicted unusual protein kinase regulating ubiquinone biosynthesis (AarF/ABC1/UbiB family)
MIDGPTVVGATDVESSELLSQTGERQAGPIQKIPIDRRRYLRVSGYFAGTLLNLLFWDVLFRRISRDFVQRRAERRWRRLARRFRALAVELGGVLIKLGQFLSVRVDILPQVVTAELAGLQDEVPAVGLTDIQAVIESEYGQPTDSVFSWFASQPEAAASLAQVHRARLLTGSEVVVKVQRPKIEITVETDLRAIETATRWLKRYRPLGRRVDLEKLIGEFSSVTRRELDFVAEGENAERFALNFADDPNVRIPRVFAESSTRRVLIMEDVSDIKITDLEALAAVGIDRREVARCLFDTYLRQMFTHNFVHADPHPGNLFVQPLPSVLADLGLFEPSQGTPFRLVFVDFGMVAVVPERVRKHLRDFLVGFATRDMARITRAYQGAGFLLPGADLTRLEQMETDLMERFSGLTMRQARQLARSEWQSLAQQYRDVIYEMPFQLPTDLLFIGRAVAILLGMATTLDPEFDPWEAIKPFASEMAAGEVKRDWRSVLGEIEKASRLVLSLPSQADRFLSQANQGKLAVRTSWSPEATRTVRRVEKAVNRLAWAVVFAALVLSAVAIYIVQGGDVVSYALFGLAAVALLVLLTRR